MGLSFVPGPHSIQKPLRRSSRAMEQTAAAHGEINIGKKHTSFTAGEQSQHQGVLLPLEDCEGGC